jgi:hypothetical protein
LTPTASRENISAIIELTDEKGSRVIGAALRFGGSSLRDEAAIFAQSASLRRASASEKTEPKNCAIPANALDRIFGGGFTPPPAAYAMKPRSRELAKLTKTFRTSKPSIGWKCPLKTLLPHGTNSDFQIFML